MTLRAEGCYVFDDDSNLVAKTPEPDYAWFIVNRVNRLESEVTRLKGELKGAEEDKEAASYGRHSMEGLLETVCEARDEAIDERDLARKMKQEKANRLEVVERQLGSVRKALDERTNYLEVVLRQRDAARMGHDEVTRRMEKLVEQRDKDMARIQALELRIARARMALS